MLETGWGKGQHPTLLVRIKVDAPTMEIEWRFLRRLKTELQLDPALLHLGIDVDKSPVQKDAHIPMFTAALFTIGETWKPPKRP